ncbi:MULTISPECIES: hypothetical protein [Nocardia]|uniref:hypothetical protein n=1 Tax=Nocardia TaxID=1817 RepID=UPI0012E1E186|nr:MULTISPECIES: hypothetical protein [Nocardia]
MYPLTSPLAPAADPDDPTANVAATAAASTSSVAEKHSRKREYHGFIVTVSGRPLGRRPNTARSAVAVTQQAQLVVKPSEAGRALAQRLTLPSADVIASKGGTASVIAAHRPPRRAPRRHENPGAGGSQPSNTP